MESTNLTVQSVPLAKIRPNPNNPRKVIMDEAVAKKAKLLEANGQETPVKLRSLTPGERQLDPAHEYELIDGELRYRGALQLGWPALDATIYDISAEDAQWKSVMSNEWEDLHWLARYEIIERRLDSPSRPPQRQVADELGKSQQAISRVVSLLKVLNKNSRAQIYQALVKKSPSWELTEFPVYSLTALEDPELVEKALQVLINRQMTEPEAKKLVKWIKTGHNPGDFGQKSEKAAKDPDDPYASYWEPLPDQVQVTKGKNGYRVVMELAPNEAIPVVYGAMSNWEFLKGQAGEKEDPRYRLALPRVHKDAVPMRKKEMADQAQAETARKAALEAQSAQKARKEDIRRAQAQAKAEKRAARQAAKGEKAKAKAENKKAGAQKAKPGNPPPATAPALREPQDQGQNRGGGVPPRDDKQADPKPAGGFLGKIGEVLHEKTGLTPRDLKEGIENMLVKDAKQAANYEVRRKLRNIFKDLF